jgi:hypothetical protein
MNLDQLIENTKTLDNTIESYGFDLCRKDPKEEEEKYDSGEVIKTRSLLAYFEGVKYNAEYFIGISDSFINLTFNLFDGDNYVHSISITKEGDISPIQFEINDFLENYVVRALGEFLTDEEFED